MDLHKLLQDVVSVELSTKPIRGLSVNSQSIQPGEVFIALKGHQNDGRKYINDALANGACAVLCEAKDLDPFSYQKRADVPVVAIENLQEIVPLLAKRFYGGHNALHVIGVTGTNGKTTTCYLLAQALSRLGQPCAISGTVGYGFIDALKPSPLTTPDPIALHKMLLALKAKEAKFLAMEVSSIGIEERRVDGIDFVSAHFTNLTQDHLDYHQTMETYGLAKQKLFRYASLNRAIINADDPYAEKICLATRRDIPIVMYSLSQRSPSVLLNRSNLEYISVKDVELTHKGIKANVHSPWGQGQLRSNLIGEFNLYNLLGVLAELCMQGFSLEEALHTLYYLSPAPGRMQRFGTATTPLVIVDYAHTPDALESALRAAKLQCSRRLWCVFGCGGERDKDKRAKMGNVAAHYADRVVITNDNPRREDPLKIVDDILGGFNVGHTDKVTIELERGKAIQFAIENALALDTILIAGKGHENYQQIGDKCFPFSDAEFVKNLLNKDSHDATISHS